MHDPFDHLKLPIPKSLQPKGFFQEFLKVGLPIGCGHTAPTLPVTGKTMPVM